MRSRTRTAVTTALDIAGCGLLVGAAAVIWWPAALIVGGAACLAISWAQR